MAKFFLENVQLGSLLDQGAVFFFELFAMAGDGGGGDVALELLDAGVELALHVDDVLPCSIVGLLEQQVGDNATFKEPYVMSARYFKSTLKYIGVDSWAELLQILDHQHFSIG